MICTDIGAEQPATFSSKFESTQSLQPMKPVTESVLLGLSSQELSAIVEKQGEHAYRARQIFEALYRQRVSSVDLISTLPQSFRQNLMQQYSIGLPQIERKFES